ncbi:NTP transferase domain-containing protein [Mesobacillus zeae]|uniref:Xanthine dehydrogenase n=1 Tax=Mesobacillus zeae TaxID=1917180 RepID=A0A398B7I6_9BACI|nr:NTP transferase domain-containing protein [Mesobacillus zeae]RID85767.1 xanthine dehydrogenase [Mesobacillus zeae]
MRVIGIYLAAGESKRMGIDKRYLPFNQVPLGSVVLKEALLSKLEHIVVITRKDDSLDWLQRISFSSKWSLMECEHATEGQGSSIQCGLKRAVESNADAAMILLADQPFVTTEVINTLIESYQQDPDYYYIAAGNGQIPMPPILFSPACFPYLHQLTGDQGARYVIRGELFNKGKIIDSQKALIFFDVDTQEDYSYLQSKEQLND